MASSHAIRVPVDHKVVISEMMTEKKAAKTTFATNPSPNAQDFQAYTDATIRNQVQGNLTLLNSYNYSGNPIGPYPSTIEQSRTQEFSHKAINTIGPEGSKGCVVYSGYNIDHDGEGKEECAWLLAWHTPIGGSECKVYVECGRVAPYQPDTLDWDIIKQKLDKSSNKSHFKHMSTKAEASAEIAFDDGTANLASLFNVFN